MRLRRYIYTQVSHLDPARGDDLIAQHRFETSNVNNNAHQVKAPPPLAITNSRHVVTCS